MSIWIIFPKDLFHVIYFFQSDINFLSVLPWCTGSIYVPLSSQIHLSHLYKLLKKIAIIGLMRLDSQI